jgi:hypothetical protein
MAKKCAPCVVVERVPRKDTGRVDLADGFLCAVGARLALCGDVSWSYGDVTRQGGAEKSGAWYGGATLGFVPQAKRDSGAAAP